MSVSRLTAEKNAKAVHEIALLRGNDRCADCKTRNPRWASHNLGIFICVSCASIHRKIGTHITKVKSLTLDSWSKEQVDTMRNIGNIKSNQLYNPDEVRHPPPTNMVDSERDGELEKFIRDKYEFKRFMNKSAVVQQHLGPSRSITSVRDYPPARSATAPLSPTSPTARSQISPPTTATSFGVQQPSSSALLSSNPPQPQRSSTNPFPPVPPTSSNPVSQATQAHASASAPTSGPWDDLISLQGSQDSSVNASMPLQYAPTMSSQPMSIPNSPIDQSAANYTRTGMPGASSNFTGASPNFGGGLASSFTAGAAPSFATGSSPSFGAAAGGFSSGAFQQQSSPANPFSQMMTQQAYQQPQPSFMPSNTPSNPFPRQTSPFQPQQSPFQLQQPSFQPQMPSLQSQQAAFQQPQFQMQPPIGTQQQQFGQQPANPFFNQQQQQQQQQYSQFAASPMVISPAMSPQGGTPMGMNVGMGMGTSSPFGQSAPQQATNPFTSWMTQPTQVQGGQWGAR